MCPDQRDVWKLVRFAIDTLKSRKELFIFLNDLTCGHSVIGNYMFKTFFNEKHHTWPQYVSDSVGTRVGEIVVQLPLLVLAIFACLWNEQKVEACVKSLLSLLDTQSAVKWFTDDESIPSQELKRPLIAQLYEAAIALSIIQIPSNISRAYRIYNRLNDFMNSSSMSINHHLELPTSILIKALNSLVEDNLQTNGSDDLFKWLLLKIKTQNVDDNELRSVLEDVADLIVKNESKLKGIYPAFNAVTNSSVLQIDLATRIIKWAISQAVPAKEIVQLVQKTRYTQELMTAICELTINDTVTSKHLLDHMLLSASHAPAIALQASKDALALLGEIDSEGPDENSYGNEHSLVKFKFVTRKTAASIAAVILNWITSSLAHCEWMLKQCKVHFKDGNYDSAALTSLCKVFQPIVQCQVVLTCATLTGVTAEKLQLSLQKTYRLAAHVLAFLMTTEKPFDLESLKVLFVLVANELSPNVYTMIPLVQQLEAEQSRAQLDAKRMKKAKSGASKSTTSSKTIRESKLLPTLIFNIEIFDKHLLEIARKKNVTLVDQIYRSTARDFRIQTDELEAVLQNFQLEATSDATSESAETAEQE